MTGDPRRILVSEGSCDACSSNMIRVFHEHIPTMQVEDASAELAVELLAVRLEADLECIADQAQREIARNAINDARAYLASKRAGRSATTAR